MLLLHYVMRSLRVRFRANLITTLSVALFVAAGILGLGVYLDLKQRLVDKTPSDQVLVLAKGATSEANSQLSRDVANAVAVIPGVKKTDNTPRIARELVSNVYVNDDPTKFSAPADVRGIDALSYEVHDAKVIEGSAPQPGSMELLVGRTLQRRNPSLRVGTEIALPGGPGKITGVFAGRLEGELWMPRQALELHLKRQTSSSMYLIAESPAQVAQIVSTLNTGKQYEVEATSLRDYLAKSGGLKGVLRAVLILLILLSTVAGVAITTTMNAAVTLRLPELASLVAIGFPRSMLGRLVVVESILLAVVGTVLGFALSLPLSQLMTKLGFAPVGLSTSIIVPIGGALLGLIIGIIGGTAPAFTVGRLDVIRSMR